MELTQKERERIYFEEKAKRECRGGSRSTGTLIFLSTLAVLGVAAIFFLSNKLEERQVSLDDLRKAYPGLAPEDQE